MFCKIKSDTLNMHWMNKDVRTVPRGRGFYHARLKDYLTVTSLWYAYGPEICIWSRVQRSTSSAHKNELCVPSRNREVYKVKSTNTNRYWAERSHSEQKFEKGINCQTHNYTSLGEVDQIPTVIFTFINFPFKKYPKKNHCLPLVQMQYMQDHQQSIVPSHLWTTWITNQS